MSANGEVRIGLNDLILGNGPGARQYIRAGLAKKVKFTYFKNHGELSRNTHIEMISQSKRSCTANISSIGCIPALVQFLHINQVVCGAKKVN